MLNNTTTEYSLFLAWSFIIKLVISTIITINSLKRITIFTI